MSMGHQNKPPPGPSDSIDWSDSHLQSLLSKTEGWSLDNRGVFSPVACELQIGWGSVSGGRPATLVFERDGVMVIEAPFALSKGEQVRVDSFQAGAPRLAWGIVMDGHDGHRVEDRANGIRVYWVHTR